MKCIVRVPNWIGDAVLSIPAIKSLKNDNSDIEIWIAAGEWVADLFTGFDFIQGRVTVPAHLTWRSLEQTARDMRGQKFDTGLLLTNSFASAWLFFRSGIPRRWGYRHDARRILLTKSVPAKAERRDHQVHYYLDLVRALGFPPAEPTLSLRIHPEEIEQIESLLASLAVDIGRPLFLLNPGAAHGSAKRWPLNHYVRLASLLQQGYGAEILIVGSSAEIPLAESIAAQLQPAPVVLAGKTTLRQLAAVIQRADLCVTNDSGPMHISNALGTPTVALFGPTDPEITRPLQAPSAVLQKKPVCWPCSYRECPFDHRCMTEIQPEEVYGSCQNLLS